MVLDRAYNPRTLEHWRVRDGVWHVDLQLGSGVPFEVAQAVVLALRRQTVVDLQPEAGRRPLSAIDPGQISLVSRDRGIAGVVTVVPPAPDRFEVQTGHGAGRSGGGMILIVTVRDGRVVLHGVRDWMA